MGANDRAVLLGINTYPGLGSLQGPENDVAAFAKWLKDPTGGAVPEANLVSILSSDFPAPVDAPHAQPTSEAFKAAIDDLHQLGVDNNGRAGDRLYLFMAGHGFAPDLEESALLMANAMARRTGHHVPGRPYADWFRRSGFFDEVVLFMDCCRENYPRAPIQVCHLEKVTAAKASRHFYGLATDWAKAARERPGDDDVVQGVFTAALVAGLRAPPGENGTTGASLKAFVLNHLSQVLAEEERQEPKFFFDDADDVVFRAPGPRAMFTIRVAAPTAGPGDEVELLDGALQPVPATTRTDHTWEFSVGSTGLFRCRLGDGATEFVEVHGDRQVIHVQL